MRRLIFTFVLFLSFSFFNCSTKDGAGNQVVYISDENVPCQLLDYEKVIMPDSMLFAASNFRVCHDSILLVMHEAYPDPYYLSVVNLNNFEVINELFHRGNGPNEVLGLNMYVNDEYLYFNHYVKRSVARVPIDSVVSPDFKYPEFVSVDAFYNGYGWLSDTLIAVTNCLYFNDYGLDKNTSEVFYLDTAGAFVDKYQQLKDGVFAANFSGGCIIANPETGNFYFAKSFSPEIRLYENRNLKTIYSGPDTYKSEYVVDESNYLHFKNNYNYYYFVGCSSRNYVFFANERSHGPVDSPDISFDNGEIIRLDWDGNVVARYKLKEHHKQVEALSYCEESHLLYVSTFDEDDERVLYKVHLSD